MPKLFVLPAVLWCLAGGCASWFTNGEPPEVSVANVTPLEATAFEQRLEVDLRIRNPNDFDLSVTGIDFTLDLNGRRLARGLGNQELTVPRLGEAVTSVHTSTSTLDLVRQLLSLRENTDLAYEIRGILHLKTGRLPFQQAGVLLENGLAPRPRQESRLGAPIRAPFQNRPQD
ncbi:MAG TPA: LEA type 2 family protein [Nitrospira sp.]|nr:LEA type 2 family protein [Nitrospira sp.]